MSPDRADYGDRLAGYVEVKDRIARFYELYGQGRLVTTDVRLTSEPDGKPRVMVEAAAYRTPDDPLPGRGWSWMELPGTTPYTKGSELENTETSAWGRAIGSLGILIAEGIASGNEIRGKAPGQGQSFADEARAAAAANETDQDGLIGTVTTSGTADFLLRETPDGHALPFRVKNGRQSFICQATDGIAVGLDLIREDVLEKRVTVWGTWSDESFRKGGRDIPYRLLHVNHIKGDGFELPARVEALPETVLFSDSESETLDAAIEAAAG